VSRWQSLVADQIRRVRRDLQSTLDGLSPDLLDRSPALGANTIGWLGWHLTRSHDRNVSEIRGAAQLWIAAGWYERFGREPDPGETGFGHTPEQLASFRSPSASLLVAYHAEVVDMVLEYLADAPDDDLEREVTSPTLGNTWTVGRRVVGVLAEGLEHVGQMAYLRGLLDRA
jgi:DinB superfamily